MEQKTYVKKYYLNSHISINTTEACEFIWLSLKMY